VLYAAVRKTYTDALRAEQSQTAIEHVQAISEVASKSALLRKTLCCGADSSTGREAEARCCPDDEPIRSYPVEGGVAEQRQGPGLRWLLRVHVQCGVQLRVGRWWRGQ
jgi:hypothetical protein